jgi:alkylation response protein AidB-like acyl-CoA dehydrogenase
MTTGMQLIFPAIELTDGEHLLVHEVRAFARRVPFRPSAESPTRGGFDRDFTKQLDAHGWVGMTIPEHYGGTARSSVERCLVISELLAAGAPLGAHWTADRQTAPSLLVNGPESLRQALLPQIAAGRCLMAGGFSEPEAGSDLASVRTRARRVDGGWLITGRKIWTTDADRADYIEILCRTSNAPRKHQGLSLIVVPMDAPGVEVQPIEGMDGEHHFNEVVLDEVFAPDGWLIGEEGSGWQQLTAELALERAGPERYLSTFPLFEAFVQARADAPVPDAAYELIGRVVAQQMGLRQMSLSIARLVDHGGSPVAEAAMAKDLGTELEQLLVDELWAYRHEPLRPGPAAKRFHEFLDINRLRSAVFTTAGGTNEVLRLLVGRKLKDWAATRKDWALRSPVAEGALHVATAVYADPATRSVPRGSVDAMSLRVADELCRGGFLGVSVPESRGGGGGTLDDALDAITGAAYAGASTPLIEGPVTAGWLLSEAGVTFPWVSELAVLSGGAVAVSRHGPATVLDGVLHPTYWACQASALVVPVEHDGRAHVAVVAVEDLPLGAPGADTAGEPLVGSTRLVAVAPREFADSGMTMPALREALRRRAALGRATAIAAVLQRCAELSIEYAEQREQFGQPIARFQAVQTHLTRLASEAQRVAVLVDRARAGAEDPAGPPFAVVAGAKALAGEAAMVAARTAHQVHGAIGVTMEYPLQRFTRRLWEWALRDGTTAEWATALGARACETDLGAWWLITGTD